MKCPALIGEPDCSLGCKHVCRIAPMPENPTFDQWFERKHLDTFDALHMQPSMRIEDAMRALSKAVREYVSEMVKR